MRVYGWAGEKLRGRGEFDNPPDVHHRNTIAEMSHYIEIVRDKQVGE